MKGGKMFLVRLDRDLRIQKIVRRPIEIYGFDEDGEIIDVELVEKTAIVCDVCGTQALALTENDLENGLPVGYALCDNEYVYQVVCDSCRRKYFGRLKIYDNLDQVMGEGLCGRGY